MWAPKLTPEWVDADAKNAIKLPSHLRRWYIASSTHGGVAGGFNSSLSGVGLPTTGPNCLGNDSGTGLLPTNPVPLTQTVNALRVHFRNWVLRGTLPPNGLWPRLKTEADKRHDDDDGDGNEVGGVPNALTDAPLGTYLGWNITAGGARPFHQVLDCNYAFGKMPFAKTQAERLITGDTRLSLQERYCTQESYVAAVTRAAANAVAKSFLPQADADALIAAADASLVLR